MQSWCRLPLPFRWLQTSLSVVKSLPSQELLCFLLCMSALFLTLLCLLLKRKLGFACSVFSPACLLCFSSACSSRRNFSLFMLLHGTTNIVRSCFHLLQLATRTDDLLISACGSMNILAIQTRTVYVPKTRTSALFRQQMQVLTLLHIIYYQTQLWFAELRSVGYRRRTE